MKETMRRGLSLANPTLRWVLGPGLLIGDSALRMERVGLGDSQGFTVENCPAMVN